MIYDFLGTIQEDGTKDQLAPVKFILETRTGSEFYSLDLSAATDRLPVHLQEDILEALGLGGRIWKQILDRPYVYDGVLYKYAVGQPMGAYSSFAMLALTNHLLVHVAHLKAFNKSLTKGLGLYAVLGDDIVISDSELAKSYNYFMNYILGVVINPIKGFEGDLIEFAKNWFHNKGQNLTPFGSKSLMRAIRNPLFITAVLTDYNKKDYNSILQLELSVLTTILTKLFDKEGLQQWKWLFSILGPQGGFWRLGKENLNVKLTENLFNEFLSLVGVPMLSVTNFYYSKLAKSSWTPMRSFRDLWGSYVKLFKFILKPNIWSNSKFKKMALDPKYTAVLTTATVSVITFPLLFLSFLRAVRF